VESQDRSFGGILGVLADIIKVERGYEEAVSTFLNSHAQILVAEKDSDIRNAVEYLKSNRLGKASFVSLETLKRINSYNGTASIPSGFIPLKNFIKADSKCQAVVEYFFSNVYFTESAENLPSAADHLSFVTRNGFLYDRGKVSAGSSSESEESLLIGRKGRLDGLKSELKQLGESAACLSAERAKKNAAAESLKAEIRALEEAVHAEDISFANAKAKKESEEAAVKKLKEELAVVELELEESNEAVNELTLRGEELNKELNHIESEKASLELLINELQNTLGANRQEKETLALQVTALKTEMLSFDKEEAAIKENLGTEEAYLAELNESLASKKSLLAEHTAKAISLEEEIASLKLQNEEVSIELRRLGEESGKADKEKSDLIDKLSIDELQLKDREESAETLRNQARDLDVKLTELNFKKSALKERVNQSYKANLETLHIEIDEGADWDAIKTQVAELKEKLDGMGPVNLVAIDEHKELEERYAFLTHQHEDLLNAKDSLLKAIQKINKTTKDLFIDTFQKIQVEFKNFFRMLFGGGQAELVLIDEQDILESGIEIIVRPPGKKLQNLMLMSGGEKALTATALLFAIFKVKPSPFCVLDEIDAPLDESNIGRFANVLKEFLKMSQFIIITHNKRTIELADVMYGITMQERGISKIVSVKFSDGREERVKGASEEKKEDREGVLV
jgi:chromosome segregation protein